METARKLTLYGAIFGFLAVAIGAFGAHALRTTLDASPYGKVFETGVQYQMAHSLALLLLAALCDQVARARRIKRVAMCFAYGIVLFSGSLYALAITGRKEFGVITPFGGLAFLIGWVLLALSVANPRSGEHA